MKVTNAVDGQLRLQVLTKGVFKKHRICFVITASILMKVGNRVIIIFACHLFKTITLCCAKAL